MADPAYRTISEVAALVGVPQHVLRFWETRFPEIQPLKRGGNRRYYRPQDIALLTRINHLLHTDGYTIRGVQQLLASGEGSSSVAAAAPVTASPMARVTAPASLAPASLVAIRAALATALAAARAL